MHLNARRAAATGATVMVCALVGAPMEGAQSSDTSQGSGAGGARFRPSWHKEDITGASPGRIEGHAMAFDAGEERVISFGGYDVDGLTNETWAWDGSGWEELQPAKSPKPRWLPGMAYDPVREEVVLFGGRDEDFDQTNDTWLFKDGEWSRSYPKTSPPKLGTPVMAFDPNLQQVIQLNLDGDTWTWDGTTWTRLHPATSPPGRELATLAYHPTRDALVMYGGYGTASDILGDTWSWDGKDWTEESPGVSPAPLYGYAMSTLGRYVALFGGQENTGGAENDTWVLKRNSWQLQTPRRTPNKRSGIPMAWDPIRREAVLIGRQKARGERFGETWTLTP